MLAVVVLVPIVIMILACSLERFEALTTRVAPAPRAPRVPAPAAPAPSSHLRLVRAGESGSTVDATPAAADELRRAS